MNNRTAIPTLRMMTVLTMATLVWACHFLTATVGGGGIGATSSITIVSAQGAIVRTVAGRRDGERTHEDRAFKRTPYTELGTLSRQAITDIFAEDSRPILILLVGAFFVSFVAPIRSEQRVGAPIAIEPIDRKAA